MCHNTSIWIFKSVLKFGPIVSPVEALEAVTIVLCPKALPLLAVAHKSSSNYRPGMSRSASRACKAGLKNIDSSAATLFPSLTAAQIQTEKSNRRDITQQETLTCLQSPAPAALAVPVWRCCIFSVSDQLDLGVEGNGICVLIPPDHVIDPSVYSSNQHFVNPWSYVFILNCKKNIYIYTLQELFKQICSCERFWCGGWSNHLPLSIVLWSHIHSMTTMHEAALQSAKSPFPSQRTCHSISSPGLALAQVLPLLFFWEPRCLHSSRAGLWGLSIVGFGFSPI